MSDPDVFVVQCNGNASAWAVGGHLIGLSWALVAPWPETISIVTPLAVRIWDGIESGDRWRTASVAEIIVYQSAGTNTVTESLGFLNLREDAPRAGRSIPPAQDRVELVRSIETNGLVASVYATLGLTVEGVSQASATGLPALSVDDLSEGRNRARLPTYSVTSGPSSAVAFGLCRLLGWD